jgi:N-acetylglucosamine kinase-like BadF-type ATPase
MAYFLGIDGGNSKTHALIIDERGYPVGFCAGSGSDFQEVGLDQAKAVWAETIREALVQARLGLEDLAMVCFCLAGADLPEDYQVLQTAAEGIVSPARVTVKNDTIAALRAGLHANSFGVTVVVGTGFNAAGRGQDGREVILPGLGYLSGDYGGGRWMGRQIIRAVMRAWDGRGPSTALRQAVLDVMGVPDELALIRALRQDGAQNRILNLVPLLFDIASQGDEVAKALLTTLGEEVGLTAGVIIRRLGLEDEAVPVILSTSVYRGKGALFLNAIKAALQRAAPKAYVLIPDFIPVVGAALEALAASEVEGTPDLHATLRRELSVRYPNLLYPQVADESWMQVEPGN